MGMFDDVKFEMDCPKCGKKITGFQSKDGSCTLDTLHFWEVDNFYSDCENCQIWIEFTKVTSNKKRKPDISDYKMEVRKAEFKLG